MSHEVAELNLRHPPPTNKDTITIHVRLVLLAQSYLTGEKGKVCLTWQEILVSSDLTVTRDLVASPLLESDLSVLWEVRDSPASLSSAAESGL